MSGLPAATVARAPMASLALPRFAFRAIVALFATSVSFTVTGCAEPQYEPYSKNATGATIELKFNCNKGRYFLLIPKQRNEKEIDKKCKWQLKFSSENKLLKSEFGGTLTSFHQNGTDYWATAGIIYAEKSPHLSVTISDELVEIIQARGAILGEVALPIGFKLEGIESR